jgi:oligoendopeptidase F
MRWRSLLALLAALVPVPAQTVERAQIAEKYTWNLADLYRDEAAWAAARDDLRKRIPALHAFQGHLGDSADALYRALDAIWAVQLELDRVGVYATSLSDQDLRAGHPRELRLAAEGLQVDYAAAVSWLEPELLGLGDKVKGFVAADPRLAPWAFYLESLLRRKPHTLSASEERLLAEAGNVTGAGQSMHSVLVDADLPYPTVKLTTGAVRLDASAYSLRRASPVRADREKVFAAFFGALKGFERTLGATLDAQVRAHVFVQRARGYASTLEAALFPNAIPTTVYRQLIADVHRSLPTLHRYLRLRQRMLGVDRLRYSDLYAPLVRSVDLSYTPEEAQRIVLAAVAPLGKEYVDTLQKGFGSRWTDFLPSPGKRTGAYSSGVWGVHPIQLLNFNGKYEDLTTLAHEAGHSMHTFLANRAQPYPTAGYATFVAEIASTLNENLLLHHLLDHTKDDTTRLAMLGSYLEGMRTTLFRQTMFAEFELTMHEMAEHNEPITGEALSARYLKLVREYYGHDAGVCEVPDLVATEWAYIPHFFYDFYLFQYATSLTISTALAQAIRADAGHGAADRYLAMLQAGGSAFPIDLVRRAGVDPTTSVPFDAAVREMTGVMDEMEQILARQKK